MKKGIIPIVSGGLGNQMFVISAAYIAHKKNNIPLYIFDNTLFNNSHNKEKINYNDSIFKGIGRHVKVPYTEIHKMNDFKDYVRNSHTMQDGYKSWNPENVKEGEIMYSYYQYYPVLAEYEHELRTVFISGLSNYITKLKNDLKTTENDAFLHVRRGDYLGLSDIHYIQPLSYYSECLEKLLEANKKISRIFVLSDDVEWIKSQGFFRPKIFHVVENFNEIKSLALMSLCKGGAICANSTFSWWGAFLGAYEHRNPIYVPKKWINGHDDLNLFPEEWNIK